MTTNIPRAIIHISTKGAENSRINYSRRMYAIIRRYTPDVVEGNMNECLADLTGLRTFFKMTYAEIAEKIKKDLVAEIGVRFTVRIATTKLFEETKARSKKSHTISTYKEIHSLLGVTSLYRSSNTASNGILRKKRFAVPFIGKVS